MPLSLQNLFSDILLRSFPSKLITPFFEPRVRDPCNAEIDLPDPLSPVRARISPAPRLKEISLTIVSRELQQKISYRKKRHFFMLPLSLGSSASPVHLLKRFKPKTVIIIATPGTIANLDAKETIVCASASILPQLGVGVVLPSLCNLVQPLQNTSEN